MCDSNGTGFKPTSKPREVKCTLRLTNGVLTSKKGEMFDCIKPEVIVDGKDILKKMTDTVTNTKYTGSGALLFAQEDGPSV